MPGAKCLQSTKEFMSACYEGQGCLQQIMDGHKPNTVIAGKSYIEFYSPFAGVSKVNLFLLVPDKLYGEIKAHQWGAYGNDWTGFRSVPGNDASVILNKSKPTKQLAGGTIAEVGGYEKQPGVKYYDAKEPSLNLEFKYNSAECSFIARPADGVLVGRPNESWSLNVHVKQVAKPRNTY